MPTLEEFDLALAKSSNAATKWRRVSLAIPPNFFAITMGLAGLARIWHLAGEFYGVPVMIGDALYLLTALVFLLLVAAFVTKFVLAWESSVAEFQHPLLSPFNSLLPISGMLLSLGLEPYAHDVAFVLFLLFFSATILFSGWIIGQWMVGKLDVDICHPGYLLPTVTGPLVGADMAAHFGLVGLGWMSFGIGMISWFVISSVIMNRLFFRSMLPTALIPTLAIQVTPPAVSGNAYFTLTCGRIDVLAYMLAGYAVLMVLVQLRMFPTYCRLSFMLSFWTFTFSYAVVISYQFAYRRTIYLRLV